MSRIKLILTTTLLFSVVSAAEPSSSLEATTIINSFNATFSWNIENLHHFDFGSYQAPKQLYSPILTAVDRAKNDTVYNMTLYIEPDFGRDYYNNKGLYKYKINLEANINPEEVDYKYSINGSVYKSREILKDSVSGQRVTIIVTPTFSKMYQPSEVTLLTPRIYVKKPPSLATELLQACEEDPNIQFTIINGFDQVVKKKVKACIPIMQARSWVFKKLLANATEVAVSKDYPFKVYHKMVEFCNTDSIADLEGEEINLYHVSRTYNIPSLVLYMGREIAKSTNITNVLPRFNAVFPYSDEPLVKSLYEFMVENFLEVSKQPEFSSLRPDLYQEILKKLLKYKKII